MAANTLLLLFATTLTQATIGLRLEEFHASPARPGSWPCPEPTEIAPCECTNIKNTLHLDCSNVTSDADLQSVFNAHFPFTNFTHLTIIAKPSEKRVPINFLTKNIFQNVTFANIRISHTDLSFIYPDVFDKSAPFLETIAVTDNFFTYFPFDMVDKAPLLTDIRVFRNIITHMPEMTSDKLTYLHIGYNPEIQFGDHAFEFLPNLEYLVANDIELNHVATKAFVKNTKLKYLDMSHNHLETLYKDSLMFQSPIEEIRLNANRITTVEAGAISGLGKGRYTLLWMHNNELQHLEKIVWEPVFSSVITKIRNFVFDGNPLICQCDILWLVENNDHRNTIANGTICSETGSDLLAIDVDFLQTNCP